MIPAIKIILLNQGAGKREVLCQEVAVLDLARKVLLKVV